MQLGTLFRAEAMRLRRSGASLAVLATLLMVLIWTAWSVGSASAERRRHTEQAAQRWQALWAQSQAAAAGTQDARKSALAAFNLARHQAPPTALAPGPAPALAQGQFQLLPTALRANIDGRHTESRRGDELGSPVLHGQGTPDLAVVVALLVPLAVIALGYGRVQEDRASGVWNLVRSQTGQAWRPFVVWLLLLWGVLMLIVSAGCAVAWLADPHMGRGAFGIWVLACAAFTAFWVALAGLANMPRISAAAGATLLLAGWVLLSFGVPAVLDAMARGARPMPSRIASIAAVREIQQSAEQRSDELLAGWYTNHPQHRRDDLAPHAWPVSWVPRYLWQDAQLRPLMLRFDETRANQHDWVAQRSALAPGVALVLVADRLAGIDARRHLAYVREVNRYEDAWRAHFVPRVMSYAGLSADAAAAVPQPRLGVQLTSAWPVVAGLLGAAALAWSALLMLRRGFG